MEQPVSKQTVFEHFEGRTSPLQRHLLEEWLKTPVNRETYYEWLEEWETRHLQYIADTDGAMQQSLTQLAIQPTTEPAPAIRKPWMTLRRAAAAALVLLTLSAGLYLIKDYVLYKTFETAYGQVKKITLTDGTIVTLNAHSTLRLSRFGFGKEGRHVYLTGEADFDVTHTPDHQPFQVHIDKGFDVTVLGTQFTVYARTRKTQLLLKTGKVRIDYTEGARQRKVFVKPGELVSLDPQGRFNHKTVRSPRPYDAWKEYRYEFHHTPLQEIAYMLQENYGLQVEITGTRLAGETVNGTFPARTAEELLQAIALAYDINVNRQDSKVVFFE
ncbi:MAG: FecR domain-containing protein [Siphonobacter aquaeclarae]|nr:FecR domain-containing protein [Siphonobacter aquaeclarae]